MLLLGSLGIRRRALHGRARESSSQSVVVDHDYFVGGLNENRLNYVTANLDLFGEMEGDRQTE